MVMAEPNSPAYERHKESMRRRSAALSRSGRDIGSIPAVKNPRRKMRALKSFRLFLEEYFPERFKLKWGAHHLLLIARIQDVILFGGSHAVAMPRGDGKTTIVELAPLWAAFIGKHSYVFLIGNSEPKATEMLESIKMELMYNDELYADFPEVCYPIRKLEGQTRRATGQLHHGTPTEIKWSPDEIKLPTIPGSKASGATIRVAGITGNIRGAVKTLPDGRRIRPTLALVDDPQTDESARSLTQCEYRYQLVAGAIMGLAGAGSTMSALVTCTIIRPDDLADRLLDRKRSPDWTGERTSMVVKFPDNEDLWEEYGRIRAESLESLGNIKLATEFYRKNRVEMDRGAVVAWEERYDRQNELSAIQAAMNLKFRDERAFFAEFQNDPLPETEPDGLMLSATEIAGKTNNHARRLIPGDAQILVGHIDVMGRALYYTMAAFNLDFTGYIVDYGVWPRQNANYFTMSQIKVGLSEKYPKKGLEGSIYQGLSDLVGELVGEWKVDGRRGIMRPSRILIDAGWGTTSDTIYKFCRQNQNAPILMPTHGRGVTAGSQPMNQRKRGRGERVGHNWRITNAAKTRVIRYCLFDSNYWKSFMHARLMVSEGAPGTLSLFEHGERGRTHQLFADHLTSEVRIPTEGRGRKVDQWDHADKSRDNHWLDSTVGCYVAASMEGASVPEIEAGSSTGRRRRKVSLHEIQARKRGVA